MELHRLRYLLAIVDEGSVTEAARRLQVAQSGVSSQLAKLERELGVAIFRRVGRGVVLTEEGRALVPAVRNAVHAVDAVTASAADLRGLVTGSLTVGTVANLIWPPLFEAIGELHSRHPGIDLHLTEATSHALLTAVRRGEADVAIATWAEKEPSDLNRHLVVDDPLVAVVSATHPWAARSTIKPVELTGMDVISLEQGTGSRDALDAMMRRAALSIVPRWEVAGPSFVKELAGRGLGVAIVSETTASTWGLSCIPLADDEARSRLGIVWRQEPSAAARAFLIQLRGRADDPSQRRLELGSVPGTRRGRR
ncbi:LysR family transcriptional regulator [Microbacterium sp. YMB-B2]|uniref:LysR family transcriptional regulator n=1 Tax=Microbacterium tenebrionis TaxID=2830665 RepID=A0A9X1S1Q4_9MICO|nr:LysR family transcriptional regulator [Microbacterium tenebrionis]MCC2030537.1 LysR family transcriptional regulator [Microbacterium tenebrionis]